MSKKNTENNFLVSWCCEGLETVVPVTEIEKENLFTLIKGDKALKDVNHILNMMILRAKFNPQRFYEIYAVSGVDGISESDIREMFNNSPQTAADIIREKGVKVYSDRQTKNRNVIE